MNDDGLGNLAADGQDRIERSHGFLEDHRDLVPPDVAHRPLGLLQQVLAFEFYLATNNPAGRIGVYEDALGTDSEITDTGGSVTLYVVHDVANSMGASFRIEAPAGWTRTLVQNQFNVTLGNPEDGVAVGFGDCLQGPIHILTLTYDSPGNSAPDAMFKVRPHSGIPDGIETVDCTRTELRTTIGVSSPVVVP